MIKFVNKKTGELKNAFSVKENDEKIMRTDKLRNK